MTVRSAASFPSLILSSFRFCAEKESVRGGEGGQSQSVFGAFYIQRARAK